MRTVHLHGALGEKFGKQYQFDVVTANECIRALSYQLPGFRQELQGGGYYTLVRGNGTVVDEDMLNFTLGSQDIHIVPAIEGQGSTGRAILGAVLIASAFVIGGPIGQFVGNIGIAMFLGSILEMLAPSPKLKGGNTDSQRSSFLFNSQQDTTVQGTAVPIVYGTCWTVPKVVSAGISTERVEDPTGELNSPWIVPDDVDGAGGGKGSPSQQVSPFEYPNTLFSQSRVNLVDLISEGPCGGLVDGLKSVKLNRVAIQNDDGSYNFNNIILEQRLGLPDQAYLKKFPRVENPVSIGTEVTQDTPVVAAVTDVNSTAVRVTIRIPALYNANNSNDPRTSVRIAIDLQPNGGSYSEKINETIGPDKTTSPYDRDYRIELTGEGPWNVRVRRITDDSDDDQLQNETHFLALTSIIDHRFTYMHSAVIGISGDAAAFGGQVPERRYQWHGREIQIPSNLNPETRAYTGVWDGTFQTAVYDSPAWIVYDLLTNSRYGVGAFHDTTKIDKWALYAIGQYFDESVPDGFGGTEPRATFNGAIFEAEEALKVIQMVASACRSMVFWGAGSINFTADMPSDPVAIVSQANVIDGIFDTPTTPITTRHTVVHVTWFNPLLDDDRDVEVYEDAELIRRFGRKVLEIVAFGCRSRGQARRMAKWALETEKTQSELVNWAASYDQANLRPGDIVEIHDSAAAGIRRSGRIRSTVLSGVDIVGVVVDSAVTINIGQSYTLSVIMPDGSIDERTLTNAPGVHTTLTFDDPLSATPVAGAIWGVSGGVVEGKPFRIIGVQESAKNQWEFTGLFHDDGKYDRIDLNLVTEEPSFSVFPTGPIRAPTNPSVSEQLILLGPVVAQRVTVAWQPSLDSRVVKYEVSYTDSLGTNKFAGTTTTTSLDVDNVGIGTFTFRVKAVAASGEPSPAAQTAPTALNGLLAPPADVTGLKLSILGETGTLSWNAVTTLNLAYYTVKFSSLTEAATYESALPLFEQVIGTQVNITSLPGTYFVKAVTQQGVESVNAAEIASTIPNVRNQVEEISEQPTWAGDKVGTAVGGLGELRLDFASDQIGDWPSLEVVPELAFGYGAAITEGTYISAAPIDLGAVYTARVVAFVRAVGENVFDVMATWETLSEVTVLSGVSSSAWEVVLEVRITEDDPAATPVWSDWQEYVVGDYLFRGMEFRLTLRSHQLAVTPVVVQFNILVDMPDRIEGEDNLVVTTSGLRIDFAPAFKHLDGIGYQPKDFADRVRPIFTNQDELGFDVSLVDENDTPVEGTFSYTAVGYGEKVGD